MTLWQITAPHFCAAIILNDANVVVETAPILKWTMGKTRDWLRSVFAGKGWKVRFVCKMPQVTP